jgi:hypothetical protein
MPGTPSACQGNFLPYQHREMLRQRRRGNGVDSERRRDARSEQP